jgi:hypothetical protein
MILDIGCGKRKAEPEAIGIDVSADSAADHIWNLDRYPGGSLKARHHQP